MCRWFNYVNLAETVSDDSGDWVILDSGSDVSLLPLHFMASERSNSNHLLHDCQGGSLALAGTRYTDLQVEDVSGEEAVLRHEYVVGDVTTSLISFAHLYQLSWRILNSNGQLCLKDLSKKIEIPVHYITREIFCIEGPCSTCSRTHGFLCQNHRACL